ncbi:Zn-dependent alcohol dehydrogenase [Haloactinomyces albus]|uniref:Zn-dependent alcohol dehydrogenase n=1 Tax=Haloactinomyces albus TaxID=1352928 RepID=A0AAE3ZC76_9ACTN|nr:Zn-dependent alcohol dehydrogenase [Haloactinomyces albus]
MESTTSFRSLLGHEATQPMPLDGTPLSPTLGIGAFAERALVHSGQCARVDPTARPAVAGLLGCGVMAGIGSTINTGQVTRGDSVAIIGCGCVGTGAIAGAHLAGTMVLVGVHPLPRCNWSCLCWTYSLGVVR